MGLYLDACVLVSLFTRDILSPRAASLLRHNSEHLVVSDFAAAEFSSAVARQVRMQLLGAEAGREAFAKFDLWARQFTQRIEIIAADVPAADALLRRLNLPLRTPDALNLAIVRRTQSVLATFDAAMQTSAVELGIRLAEPA